MNQQMQDKDQQSLLKMHCFWHVSLSFNGAYAELRCMHHAPRKPLAATFFDIENHREQSGRRAKEVMAAISIT